MVFKGAIRNPSLLGGPIPILKSKLFPVSISTGVSKLYFWPAGFPFKPHVPSMGPQSHWKDMGKTEVMDPPFLVNQEPPRKKPGAWFFTS